MGARQGPATCSPVRVYYGKTNGQTPRVQVGTRIPTTNLLLIRGRRPNNNTRGGLDQRDFLSYVANTARMYGMCNVAHGLSRITPCFVRRVAPRSYRTTRTKMTSILVLNSTGKVGKGVCKALSSANYKVSVAAPSRCSYECPRSTSLFRPEFPSCPLYDNSIDL